MGMLTGFLDLYCDLLNCYDNYYEIFFILQSLVAFAKLKRQILLCQPEAKSPKDFTDSSLFWVNQEFAVM